jgi:CO2 hydration protein (ChpXY)
MYHFLPPYLLEYYEQHCRGKDDMLIQLGVSFQRSMFCVTSAVIQALRAALHYPLDDTNPDHLLVNRQFFEGQIDRFKRSEARLTDIQTQDYR